MSGGGAPIIVLYRVVNTDGDRDDPLFNAFPIPRGAKPPSLASVKQKCAALYGLNHLGPEGYHWRVCVEEKPPAGAPHSEKAFSWWDIQDENASLPVKQATQSELSKFFAPSKPESSSTDVATKAAKGAFKSLGKTLSSAVGHDGIESGPPVSIIAFKLIDLVKMHDDFTSKNHGRGGHIPQAHPPPVKPHHAPTRPAVSTPASRPPPSRSSTVPPTTASRSRPQQTPDQPTHRASAPRTAPRTAEEPSLMDFGPTPTGGGGSRGGGGFHAAPASSNGFHNVAPPTSETRAQKLKREYAKKNQTSQRVWDDIDQRWVDASSHKGESTKAASNNGGTKVVGISLDPTSAVGKSANVQAAVHKRVNEMKESQAKALEEMRQLQAKKKADENDEDLVRKRLEPKIKVWSEEHGKKKQLTALLASLHTILWTGAKWKQVTIGDMLSDAKVRRYYLKATLVVHPDKTHHLGPEQRFLAKRIFDALSQAKTAFDNKK